MYQLKNICLILLATMVIVSCGKKFEFIEAPVIEKNPNKSVPLAAVLKYVANQHITIEANFYAGDHSFSVEFENIKDASGGLPVIGMKAGKKYSIDLQIITGNQSYNYETQLHYTTPDLPSDPYEMLRFEVKRKTSLPMEPGITLLNPRIRAKGFDDSKFGMLAAIDSTGEIIWYYRCDSRISDFNFLPNKHISYMTADHRFIEIDLLGNVIKSWHASERPEGPVDNSIPIKSLTFHHDAMLLPNGNYLILGTDIKEIDDYYTSETEVNAPRKRQQVMGDVLIEFTPDGEIVWEWNAFEYLDPMRIGYNTFNKYWYSRGYPGVLDWTHANTVLFDSTDNTVIMNSRFLSSLTKINRDGSIKWIFGEPSGLSQELIEKSIIPVKGDWFWHQHSASFTPHGSILIFNNNLIRAWPFHQKDNTGNSHAVEFQINEQELTAEQIWTSSLPDIPGVQSGAMGDVDYLEKTGNVLVSYGAIRPNKKYGRKQSWSMVREFTRTTPANIAWELELWPIGAYEDSIGWVLFSAERITNFHY